MKKTYQNPEVNVIVIQVSQLLAGSMKYGGSTTETSGNLSRDASDLWDDDEY